MASGWSRWSWRHVGRHWSCTWEHAMPRPAGTQQKHVHYVHQNTRVWTFTAPNWAQLQCPLTTQWTNKWGVGWAQQSPASQDDKWTANTLHTGTDLSTVVGSQARACVRLLLRGQISKLGNATRWRRGGDGVPEGPGGGWKEGNVSVLVSRSGCAAMATWCVHYTVVYLTVSCHKSFLKKMVMLYKQLHVNALIPPKQAFQNQPLL